MRGFANGVRMMVATATLSIGDPWHFSPMSTRRCAQ
jgi:hypothetical protein